MHHRATFPTLQQYRRHSSGERCEWLWNKLQPASRRIPSIDIRNRCGYEKIRTTFTVYLGGSLKIICRHKTFSKNNFREYWTDDRQDRSIPNTPPYRASGSGPHRNALYDKEDMGSPCRER